MKIDMRRCRGKIKWLLSNDRAMLKDLKYEDRLTDFGKAVLKDRYLLPDEDFNDLFIRVSTAYADNDEHAARLFEYMRNLWFMPATPILSNGGTDRGLPISCFINEVEDTLQGIVDIWNENIWLAAYGGGIGTYWGNLRSIGEKIKNSGKTSGIIPFIAVQNALTLAISQGSLRRGSSAVYLPVWHPEIEEFVDIRKPTGGDPNRKALNIHNAVIISDKFMNAVENGETWDLVSPHTGQVTSTINARDLWIRILTARIETGEPYILFSDTVNNGKPEIYKLNNLQVKSSNLCSEITLTTGKDHLGKKRTAVCCLSSLNLEYFDAWQDHPTFIHDIMSFLDNVLNDFISRAPGDMQNATYSVIRERSVGLGAMGFHSFMQKKMIPFGSVLAKVWNQKMFSHIRKKANEASYKIALERGPCKDAEDLGIMERFTHKLSIAPTASISIIAGNTSPGVEPFVSNIFTQKTLTGSFAVKNKYLAKLLAEKNEDNQAVWSSISSNEGSVMHLDFLTDEEKEVFRTAFEIDQSWVIDHAADRTPYICQSQSINLFLRANITKKALHAVHYRAWRKQLKSLYYSRSISIQRADKISEKATAIEADEQNNGECLSCQ